jgi:hypothetical protein
VTCVFATELIFDFATFRDADEHSNIHFRSSASLALGHISIHFLFQIFSCIIQLAMSESFKADPAGMLGEGEILNDIGSILSTLEQNKEMRKLSDAGTDIK